ncbi:MAG: type II secretion system F family protein [Bacillota bacterium]
MTGSLVPVSILVSMAVLLLIAAWKAPSGAVRSVGRLAGSGRSRDYLGTLLNRLGDKTDPDLILGVRVTGAATALAVGFTVYFAFPSLAFIFFAAAPLIYVIPQKVLAAREKKRVGEISREFPLMVTLLRIYSRAGDLYQAMRIVRGVMRGELKRQMDLLAAELEIYPLKVALDNLAERSRFPPLTNLVGVVMMGINTGTDVDEILRGFSRRAYGQRVNDIKRRIKAQPVLMAAIPAVMMLSLLLLFVFPMYANIIDRLRAF